MLRAKIEGWARIAVLIVSLLTIVWAASAMNSTVVGNKEKNESQDVKISTVEARISSQETYIAADKIHEQNQDEKIRKLEEISNEIKEANKKLDEIKAAVKGG